MTEREDNRREPPSERSHQTYERDHWKVLDVDSVDKVFATPRSSGTVTGSDKGAAVRLDFDGSAAPSVTRDLAEKGDNVNVSAWIPIPEAVELVDQLSKAIDDAQDRNSDE